MQPRRKAGASTAPLFFGEKHANLRADLAATRNALKRVTAAGHRLEAQQARYDMRAWVMNRRARTRHLIELGGLVVKARLVELTSDNRAVLLGALLEIADTLAGENRDQITLLWRRKGSRAFRAEFPSKEDDG
jgi:hypothetical protein